MENIWKSFAGFNNASTMWIWFIPAALFTFWFSYKMVKYAEVVIAKTKFGGAFVGGALISVSTSLTELVTEITQGISGKPDVGLSDDIGANYFSTFMIAVVSLVFIRNMFIKKLDWWTKASIIFSLFLTIAFTLFTYLGKDIGIGTSDRFMIGLVPFFFLAAYLIYIYLSYKFNVEDEKTTQKLVVCSAKKGIAGFLGFSTLLLFAAFFLNITVDSMQEIYSLKSKSAGGILLSMTTAMPEVVSLVVLVYHKQPIAAVASVIGSHIFNFSLILYGDMAFVHDAIIAHHTIQDASIWKLGLSTIILIGMLSIFVIISKKIKNKYVYAVIPTLMILLYIGGWIWMLSSA